MIQEIIDKHSLNYVDWIRKKSCCITGYEHSDPHHLDAIGMGQNRNRPSYKHFTCVPLCREKHSELHQIGQKAFERRYNCNLWEVAFYNYRNYCLTIDNS